jgi:hypothetical protein
MILCIFNAITSLAVTRPHQLGVIAAQRLAVEAELENNPCAGALSDQAFLYDLKTPGWFPQQSKPPRSCETHILAFEQKGPGEL